MNKERLLKLAEHLESGKLGHEVFDFNTFNANVENGLYKQEVPTKCGTNGCALGECPIVWPDDWIFNGFGEPTLKGDYLGSRMSAIDFFSISEDEYEHLFFPMAQITECFGGKILDGNATKEQVADNIREFIAKKEQDEQRTV